ncbi:MAG: hypothetical protein P8K27_09180 [Gammaproteobacteria bacterium]|nr:hypothetical protein [Gammaproteobacteria bacterium]
MNFSLTKATFYIIDWHLSKRSFFALALVLIMSCSTQVVQKETIRTNDLEDLAEEKAESAELERLRGIEDRRVRNEAQERERIALEEEREAAERERIASEERRQKAENAERLKVEAEQRQQREEERERSYSLAIVEQEQKMELVAQLEAQLILVQSALARDEASIDSLREAILAAENLLVALVAEQEKYENIDAFGETLEPLAKSLIGELEARLEDLTQQVVTP